MSYLLENWELVLAGFVVLEKIVKLTPWPWDDILVDGIKAGLFKVVKK